MGLGVPTVPVLAAAQPSCAGNAHARDRSTVRSKCGAGKGKKSQSSDEGSQGRGWCLHSSRSDFEFVNDFPGKL